MCVSCTKSILLAGRKIGNGFPCFIIAEAGVNHNGDLNMAKRLVREAKRCGADCVKFQTFKAERVVTPTAPKAAYQLKVTDPAESQFEMLRKLELSEDDHRQLIELCRREGITFLSTPYSLEDAELLAMLNVDGFKIASGQLVELPFLAVIARYGKPVILSTGMATMAEINEAVDTLRCHGNDQIAVLQCTTNYPSTLADANLRAMHSISDAVQAVVGYSDHTEGINASLAAIALGASVLEKHFTLNRDLTGPDHRCSSNPMEFAALVRRVREVEITLGSPLKAPTAAEIKNMVGMRRSIVARRLIPAGTTVTADDFTFKRPATGTPPKYLSGFIGRIARVDLPADTQIKAHHFN